MAGEPQVPPVHIAMAQPSSLVHGDLRVPVLADPRVERIELRINNVPFDQKEGRAAVFTVPVGRYLRRLRIRAIGYGLADQVVGQDEIMINDPQPPFRISLQVPPHLPEDGAGEVTFSANVSVPPSTEIDGVDFFLGETKIGTDREPPFAISVNPSAVPDAIYARAVLRTTGGEEANDVQFFGAAASDKVEVVLQQIPLSLAGQLPDRPLQASDITLLDNGDPHPIESLTPASDQPLHLILLLDSSESMIEELPVVQKAAREFARAMLHGRNEIAVVAFHQRTFWLTPFTSDLNEIDRAIDQIRPRGQTHLYDAVIEMLFELQKQPGRRALVVLSDGVNEGGTFELDHVIHYARYSGVPVYPIIRNTLLSRLMRFGLSFFEANRFAKIAEESGATYFIIRDPRQLSGVYAAIANELRQQYLVSFYAQTSGYDQWHTLGIRSSIRGLEPRIPRGYFP